MWGIKKIAYVAIISVIFLAVMITSTIATPALVVQDSNKDGKINVYDALLASGKALRGDVNKDFKVNVMDMAIVGKSFGSVSGDASYYSDADLNTDGRVNIFDMATVGVSMNSVLATGSATLSVDPASKIAYVGDEFTVDIKINTSELVYAAQFYVTFDPAILEATNITEGDFLKLTAEQCGQLPPVENCTIFTSLNNASATNGTNITWINNTIGKIMFFNIQLPDWDNNLHGASGHGILANITFRAKTLGSSVLDLRDVIILNLTDAQVNAILNDGNVDVITNKLPIANAGGPYSGYEGIPIMFNASLSYDPDGTIVKYEWDWDNNGTYDENSTNPITTHKWGDDYSGTIRLRVTDDKGATTSNTTTVTVANANPTCDAGPVKAGNEGSAVTFSGNASDVPADTLTYNWTFGDGTNASGTLMPSHAYADNGTYTVTLTVRDEDGGSCVDTTTANIANLNPVCNAGPAQSSNESLPVSFSGTASDVPADLPTLTYNWTFGDGTNASGTLMPSHAYADNGNYVVTLTVKDKDGGQCVNTTSANIANVAPNVSAGPDKNTKIMLNVRFNGSFTDPGALDTFSITWNFGDGTVLKDANLTPTHKYNNTGLYTVTLTVKDKDNGTGTDTLVVNVSKPTFLDVPPTYWSYPEIEAFYQQNITKGCLINATGMYYCPERNVRRDEMATFLVRAFHLPPLNSSVPTFVDVPKDWWNYADIEAFYLQNITRGCILNSTGRYYCPTQTVSRDQMASFLVRAFKIEPYNKTTPTFVDVPKTYPNYADIEAFYLQNITRGCIVNSTGTYYCPTNPVNRDQMAVFLVRAFKIEY